MTLRQNAQIIQVWQPIHSQVRPTVITWAEFKMIFRCHMPLITVHHSHTSQCSRTSKHRQAQGKNRQDSIQVCLPRRTICREIWTIVQGQRWTIARQEILPPAILTIIRRQPRTEILRKHRRNWKPRHLSSQHTSRSAKRQKKLRIFGASWPLWRKKRARSNA